MSNGIELTESTTTVTSSSLLYNASLDTDDLGDGDEDSKLLLSDKPQETPTTTGTSSNAQVAINITISFIGAGLLGMPRAFQNAGWLLGSIAVCVVSAINIYALLLLPKVRRRVEEGGTSCQSYGDLGLLLLGRQGAIVVNICLVVSQMGFATAYLIFIAESLSSKNHPRYMICLGCVPGLSLLVQAKDMKTLSPFSLAANLASFTALSAVLYQDGLELEEEYYEEAVLSIPAQDTSQGVLHAVQFSGLLTVMAITLYSMEGVGLVLSLEQSCRNPAHFPWLLRTVVGCITLFMALFGSVSYAAFGNATLAPVTNNLGTSMASKLVQGALCVALYLTYPIMMFPVWNIMEEQLFGMEDGDEGRSSSNKLQLALLRVVVVITTAMVAWVVPDFNDYLSLVGSSLCTLLGFLFPCYFHLKVFGSELGWMEKWANVALMLGATGFAIMGTLEAFSNLLG